VKKDIVIGRRITGDLEDGRFPQYGSRQQEKQKLVPVSQQQFNTPVAQHSQQQNNKKIKLEPLRGSEKLIRDIKCGDPRRVGRLSVIKLDIINRLADQTGIPKLKAEQAVDALFHSMKEALARGDRIELRGFGVFIVKPRKRGVGRNPRTGEEVAIPSGKTIRFKPGKELQAHGNGE